MKPPTKHEADAAAKRVLNGNNSATYGLDVRMLADYVLAQTVGKTR